MNNYKTIKTFTEEILREIESSTEGKITNPVTGSVIRSIVEAFSTSLFFIQTMVKKVYSSLYISKAKGLMLDALAKNFLIERKMATYATGLITITREDTTTEQTLVAGTLFMTEDNNYNTQKRYVLQHNVTFPVGVSQMDGIIQAVDIGTAGNTSANTITFVKNTSMPVLSVNNDSDITNGVDTETDEELKNRLILKILSLLGGNERVIRSAALEVEGVVYTFVVDDRVIPGIAYLFVNNREGDIDESIINEVREKVEEVRPMGIIITVAKSPVNKVSLYCKLVLRSNFMSNNIVAELKTQLKNYVNSLNPSQSLRISDLIGFIERHPAVDYVVNDPYNGGLQFKINDQFYYISDLNAI